MATRFKRALGIGFLLASIVAGAADDESELAGSGFTGQTLTLLYSTDVRHSVAFYKSLGFIHDYYYDYKKDVYVREWVETYAPEYAEMIQGKIRVGLTTGEGPEQVYGGGVRHYFLVDDVHAHFEMVNRNGIVAEPHEVEERPWMSFFTVADPDKHQIVFGTKNQTYYDSAREQINKLERQSKGVRSNTVH